METWEIRRASLADREGLADLCRAAEGEDDYVLELLDERILHGVFQIALDGDRIVGGMHYEEVLDGSAWLSAARTRPEYRRRGVARALMEACAGLARRSGIRALRLWSEAGNEAGNASAKGAGFGEVGRFSRLVATPGRRARPSPNANLSFSDALTTEVQDSRVLSLGHGYVPLGRAFVDLTPANVHLLANRGAFHRVGGGIAAYLADWEDTDLRFGIVAGDPARVLAEMPSVAARAGREHAVGILPYDGKVLGAARKAGFSPGGWGEEVVLYERHVPVGPTQYRKRPTYAEIAAGKKEGYAALALLAPKHGHGHTGPHEDRWNP